MIITSHLLRAHQFFSCLIFPPLLINEHLPGDWFASGRLTEYEVYAYSN